MNLPSDFSMTISGITVRIDNLTKRGFRVPYSDTWENYQGRAEFTVVHNGQTWTGVFQVKTEKQDNDLEVILLGAKEERQRLISVLNWHHGRVPSFASQFADTLSSRSSTAPVSSVGTMRLPSLGLIAIVLICAISEITLRRTNNVTSKVAYVAFPGAELDSTTAGQLMYVKQQGLIEKSEFFAAVQTSRNHAKFLEADTKGAVSAEAASTADYVRKGMPIVRLSEEGAVPYVVAFVRLTEAVTALHAVEAQVTFSVSKNEISIPVADRTYANKTSLITDDDGKPLAEINLKLPEGVSVPADEALVVEFGPSGTGLAAIIQRWFAPFFSSLA
jgi:hypothetical protein